MIVVRKLEKVLKGLEKCSSGNGCPYSCPYFNEERCKQTLFQDELDVLRAQRWISVKERLPEQNEAVNAVWLDEDDKDVEYVSPAVYYRGKWYNLDAWVPDAPTIEVTHWMPMPELPDYDYDKE